MRMSVAAAAAATAVANLHSLAGIHALLVGHEVVRVTVASAKLELDALFLVRVVPVGREDERLLGVSPKPMA